MICGKLSIQKFVIYGALILGSESTFSLAGKADFSEYSYEKEIRTLQNEKNIPKLILSISIMRSAITVEVKKKKQTGNLEKNPEWLRVLHSLQPHAKSDDLELRLPALRLIRLIKQLDPEMVLSKCDQIEARNPANDSEVILDEIDFYIEFCVIPKSTRSMTFFHKIKGISTISLRIKVDFALSLQAENSEITNFVFDAAKVFADSEDKEGYRNIAYHFCKDKGVEHAKIIVPLLGQTYYQEFAQYCLVKMSPDIWPILAPLLESGSSAQLNQVIQILNYLKPKDSISAISRRISTIASTNDKRKLRFLRLKILRKPDKELEEELLARIPITPKADFYIYHAKLEIAEYFAYLGDAEKVDIYLLDYIREKNRELDYSLCRIYGTLEKPTEMAMNALKERKRLNKSFSCGPI